jgi:two-component system CheB/CheR fusion protein
MVNTRSDIAFPVIGVGASAGGLEAFRELVRAIPEDSGMAYIFVQHLAPSHESMLTDILQKSTNVPIIEIVDQIKVEPNFIYVIPANKMLLAKGDVLELLPRPEGEKTNTIDVFLTSLAEVHQDQAIGVVLSGTGNDGTVGLKTIKDMRGITIAQDESAAYQGMPHSAIEADVVDFVLRPSDIPKKLSELLKDAQKGTADYQTEPADEEQFRQILLILKTKKGIDFKYYKQSTIRRRIVRRQAINKCASLKDYQTLLLESKTEQDALLKDMLIPVTAFFRDPKVFSLMCESILPSIIKEKPENAPIRIWVAGCSTGEEAYSLAMCVSEYFADSKKPRVVQIFATDISESVITKARSGIYDKRDVAGISEAKLKLFFTRIDGSYHINKSIREMCVFAKQNFLTDPPFAKMDIISCRNVLIYMDAYLQKKALTTFHYSLSPNGWLLLGKSESTTQVPELFQLHHASEKIYTRKPAISKFMSVATERSESAFKMKDMEQKEVRPKQNDYQQAADNALLRLYSPASVIINEFMDVVQFRGQTNAFLQVPQGKPTYNILKMAKEGLAFELRNAIHKAKITQEVICKEGILLEKGKRKVSIEVIPLTQTIDVYFAIVFKEMPGSVDEQKTVTSKVSPADDVATSDTYTARIDYLERELAQTREDMRAITEEQEAVNEELQSANEELLSGSEELQSLNEELETSKEEIQSTNEELSMLNQELIERNGQLVHARKYSEAIVTTIHEPLIVLNREFKVKSANASYYEKFNTTPKETEGKPFFDLANKQWDKPILKEKLQANISAQTAITELEIDIVINNAKRTLVINARPLVSANTDEPLILLALEDITERRILEKNLERESLLIAQQRQLLLDSFRDAPAILAIFKGPQHVCELANDRFTSIFSIEPPVGKTIYELISTADKKSFTAHVDHVFNTGETYSAKEASVVTKGSTEIFLDLVIQPMRTIGDNIEGVFFFAIDVTQQVNARKATTANLRKVLESLHQISWTALPDGTINYFNSRFFQYTGVSEEIALRQGWSAFMHPSQLKDLFDAWNESVSQNKDFQQQLLMVDKEKNYRWYMAKSTRVTDDKGDIVLWIVSCTDIHDQKLFTAELEKQVTERTGELMKANVDLKHSNADLEQFASIASHDLQEPLRKILTFVSLLHRNYPGTMPEPVVDYLGKIRSASDRMSQLIHELLEYSRIIHATKKLKSTDLDQTIKNVLEDLDLMIVETNAVIHYEQPLPSIEANPLQMNQLFYNLLTNALKFYNPGRPPDVTIGYLVPSEADIKSYNLNGSRQYIEFIISDKGIGFEQNYEQQIFQIFERLHPIEEFAGTGIGLALCKKIVENHEGHIFARSKRNRGTAFHVVLPVKQ